jgi:Subtilase family
METDLSADMVVQHAQQISRHWPIKPDVVMEAGNLGVDPADGRGYGFPEVKLLTTSSDYPQAIFESMGDTSAAAGAASRMCVVLQSRYPDMWPETIRALVVDSAEWTQAMLSHLPENPTKTDRSLLLKRYGYGVPNLDRAMFSARNALTLIAQDTIQPYIKRHGKKAALMK